MTETKSKNSIDPMHPEVQRWIADGMKENDKRFLDFQKSQYKIFNFQTGAKGVCYDGTIKGYDELDENEQKEIDKLVLKLTRLLSSLLSAKNQHDKINRAYISHYFPAWQLSDIIKDVNSWIRWLTEKKEEK